jgi:tetratricopeptide (TPR) repeat protein
MSRRIIVSGLLAFPLFATGCQAMPINQGHSAIDSGGSARAARPDELEQRGQVGSTANGLTPDIIYAVLVGEIAAQRGDYAEAYTHYLEAARLARNPELAELATHAAIIQDNQEGAAGAARFWLQLEPNSRNAHQVLALLEVQRGELDTATGHLRRLVEMAEAEGEEGYMLAARLMARVKEPEVRVELMHALVADQAENAEAQFALAMVAVASQRFDEAEQAAEAALRLRPEWEQAQIFLVRIMLLQGKNDHAESLLEEYIDDRPRDNNLRLAYARLLVEQKAYQKALREFELIGKGKPEDPEILFALGLLSVQLEHFPAARKHLKALLDTGQRNDDAAFYLGQLEELEGNREAALDWYGRVKTEHLFDAKVRIARLYAQGGEVERAREILQQLRHHAPEQALGLYLIEGEMLRELKRHEQAMAVYDQALENFPDDADLLYARALQAVSLNRLDILERDLKKILDADPDHADALNALGYTLADQTRRYEEALRYIERALELKPDDAAVLDSMGWVQYRLGNYEQALLYLRRAIEKLPDSEIAAHLGEVLWADNKKDQARRVWEEALARDPDHEYLKRVINRHNGLKAEHAVP